MVASDTNRIWKICDLLQMSGSVLEMICAPSYYGTVIGNHVWCIEWYAIIASDRVWLLVVISVTGNVSMAIVSKKYNICHLELMTVLESHVWYYCCYCVWTEGQFKVVHYHISSQLSIGLSLLRITTFLSNLECHEAFQQQRCVCEGNCGSELVSTSGTIVDTDWNSCKFVFLSLVFKCLHARVVFATVTFALFATKCYSVVDFNWHFVCMKQLNRLTF